MKTGSQQIADERERQISQEGWTVENDALHTERELLCAASAYQQSAMQNTGNAPISSVMRRYIVNMFWPVTWNPDWFKPSNPIRDLVKAGALIAAEIDRLQRAADDEKIGAALERLAP